MGRRIEFEIGVMGREGDERGREGRRGEEDEEEMLFRGSK